MEWRRSRARRSRMGSGLLAASLAMACATGSAHAADGGAQDAPPIPIDASLKYSVRYLGIHCGVLTLTSFPDETSENVYHIVMQTRTSSFFDGIYKVRVRIEAIYDAVRDSTLSYHHTGQEKSDTKDELWVVDFSSNEVVRTRDGDVKSIPFHGARVFDPLSYLYRMRRLLGAEGDRATLPMMTSEGDVNTVAEVTGADRVKTPFGKRDVLVVVPYPAKDELFTKKGKMEIWVGTDDRLPYRIVFDLPFGKLAAKLVEIGTRGDGGALESGEES